jgi:hypothetical protein
MREQRDVLTLLHERGGERDLAYRYSLLASEIAGSRLAFEEALSWLDLAAGLAIPGPEADEVNLRTAALLERAGWSEAPPVPPIASRVSRGLGRGISTWPAGSGQR